MEHPFVDFHTHQPSQSATWDSDCILYSYGFHPWWFDEHPEPEFYNRQMRLLDDLLNNHRLAAIGETGIDRRHPNTLELQVKAFEQHVLRSEQYQLPLIIHNVGGSSQLLQLHKKLRPKQPWVIHGFNGGTEEAKQLLRQDLHLSVGAGVFRHSKKITESIKSIPLDHLLLETDTSDRSIEEVYQQVAALRDTTLERLKDELFAHFIQLLDDAHCTLVTMNTASPKVLLMEPDWGFRIDEGNSNASWR